MHKATYELATQELHLSPHHLRRMTRGRQKADEHYRADGPVSWKLWLLCYATLAAMAGLILLLAISREGGTHDPQNNTSNTTMTAPAASP